MTWGCEWRHEPEVCAEDFGRFEKSQLIESCLGRRWLTFACSLWPCIRCARGLGQMEKSGVSLSFCRKTFKLKGNKKFRTWTKKSLSAFRVLGFLCSMYMCYEHFMYISHIHVWLCYIYIYIYMSLSVTATKGNLFYFSSSYKTILL